MSTATTRITLIGGPLDYQELEVPEWLSYFRVYRARNSYEPARLVSDSRWRTGEHLRMEWVG